MADGTLTGGNRSDQDSSIALCCSRGSCGLKSIVLPHSATESPFVMGWQRWRVAPGPPPNRPHHSWPTSSGSEPTIILCVPTHRYGWRSYSPESEVANFWHNATGSIPQRWQRGEPTDDGQPGKCSVIPCRRYHAQLFESHCSEKELREMAGGGSVKLKADGGGVLQDEAACLDG